MLGRVIDSLSFEPPLSLALDTRLRNMKCARVLLAHPNDFPGVCLRWWHAYGVCCSVRDPGLEVGDLDKRRAAIKVHSVEGFFVALVSHGRENG